MEANKHGLSKGVIGWSSNTMSALRKRLPNIAIIQLWAICYEGVLVASGELNATYYSHYQAHDIAALKVIVEEAGGKVTDKDGKEQRYDQRINGALVTNGLVHKQLLNFIKSQNI
jgi:fructose-1,6-bisphosphatase/inositol monophosphatase family enzyme